jgi:hypothetical protein
MRLTVAGADLQGDLFAAPVLAAGFDPLDNGD